MKLRLDRYRQVTALAQQPTPMRRLVAAIIAGSLAFLLTYLLLGVAFGAGSSATFFCAVALAVAAATAAVTMKRGMAVAYGVIAAIWVLLEALVLAIGAIASGLG